MLPIPVHNNSKYASQTNYWTGGPDSVDNWRANMQDPKNYQFFKDQQWDTETAITYQFNSHGFRCAEFDDSPVYLSIGCSFTEGVGLPIEQTWTWKLSELMGHTVLNLGVGGSSLDTCFRLIDYYIDALNVLGIFILEPPESRFEIFEFNQQPVTLMPRSDLMSDNRKLLYQNWACCEMNSYYNIQKNRLAIQSRCAKIPLISLNHSIQWGHSNNKTPARDLQHFGYPTQIYLATEFYNQFILLDK